MGNCVSASMETAPKIRVVQASEGRVVDVEVPILQSSMKVGELMLEFSPGHFVAHLNQADLLASTGKRATPLGADADAKPGAVYVLFPMPRLHTRITPQELLSFAKLLHPKAAYKPSKVHGHGRFTAGARVTPLAEEEECKDANLPSGAGAGADTNEQACPLVTVQQTGELSSSSSLSSCHAHIGVVKPKPWAPKLQTIMESS